MRMIVNVTIPNEKFNAEVKKGTVGETLGRIIEDIHPEFIYFTEQDGYRAAVMAVDIPDASKIPSIAEPWFLNFNAKCHFSVAMTPQELQGAGLDQIAKKWA